MRRKNRRRYRGWRDRDLASTDESKCFSSNEKISLANNCLYTMNKSVILLSVVVLIKANYAEFIEAENLIVSYPQDNICTAEFVNRLEPRKFNTHTQKN